MLKGIDVSKYQGTVDWEKVKPQIDFAILRCGFGDDTPAQDDGQFERNYAECTRLEIPFAVYFFTYAVNKEKIKSEIAHIKRLLAGKSISAPVYIDIENAKGLNWRDISNTELLEIMREYRARLNALGYKMGIYSSRSAFWNEKMTDPWYDDISKWVAEYGDRLNDFERTYDVWQYTSSGSIDGIDGNVDMNVMYNSVFEKVTPANGTVNVYYRVRTGGKWLPEVKNTEDYAGIKGKAITDIAVKVDKGSVKYRVHVKGGNWLPYVTGYDITDYNYGFAGCGKAIDAVEIYYTTPNDIRPYKYAYYRVSPVGKDYYALQRDNEKSGGMDGYAGLFGKLIDRMQIEIK